MLSVKLLCAAVDGSPTSSHARMSGERKREKGATNLPTVAHHLLSGNASDGLLVQDRLARRFPAWRKNDIYVAIAQPSSASLECALGYSHQGEALEKLGPKGCAGECISQQGSVSEDWKWHTVCTLNGMRLSASQLYHKKDTNTNTTNFTTRIFSTGSKSIISLWTECRTAAWRHYPEFWCGKFPMLWMDFCCCWSLFSYHRCDGGLRVRHLPLGFLGGRNICGLITVRGDGRSQTSLQFRYGDDCRINQESWLDCSSLFWGWGGGGCLKFLLPTCLKWRLITQATVQMGCLYGDLYGALCHRRVGRAADRRYRLMGHSSYYASPPPNIRTQ